eukprot:TRINITY_DN10416_c1_g1_i1.p1 TRINITY_DN10416_c1_g1~~TRINITY_DN10416_c1_g1_i1.p1  ORF type:complete len:213 (+),score=24.91 TRINITY_DN10416_c1_g1_i1:56-694(+)
MASEVPATVPCKVRTLHGCQYSVHVQTTWRIRELRDCVRKTFGIPEYEQGYLQGCTRMRSGDLVLSPRAHQSGESPELVLVRSKVPRCFSKSDALDTWYCFLAFSDDDGDTVHRRRASQIARFEGMIELARAITAQNDLPERLSFPELLWHFASLKAELPRATRRTPTRLERGFEDTLLMDIGNATCPRLQSEDSESERDEDESSDEDHTVD